MSPTRVLRRHRRRGVVALTGVATLALLMTGCGAESEATGNEGTNFVGGTGEISTVPRKDRLAAPDLSGETVDGDSLKLSDYKGEVVVLNVWGSWCAPCRAEAKHLVKVSKDTKDAGVEFVGINTRDLTREPARRFEESYGVPYPSLYDPDGKLMLEFPKGSLNPQGIPNTLIIDRDGKLAVRILTAVGEEKLREALDPIIAEK